MPVHATMEKLTTLLLEQPSAVIESGVVIPCALRDLLSMALDDRMCRFRSEESVAFLEVGGARPRCVQLPRDR